MNPLEKLARIERDNETDPVKRLVKRVMSTGMHTAEACRCFIEEALGDLIAKRYLKNYVFDLREYPNGDMSLEIKVVKSFDILVQTYTFEIEAI